MDRMLEEDWEEFSEKLQHLHKSLVMTAYSILPYRKHLLLAAQLA